MDERIGPLLLAIVFVIVPWTVILADALFLGFNFGLTLAMLFLFSVGVLFVAGTATES